MSGGDQSHVSPRPLRRRTALTSAAGAAAMVTGLVAPAGGRSSPDADLVALQRGLVTAEADWEHAIAALAGAERGVRTYRVTQNEHAAHHSAESASYDAACAAEDAAAGRVDAIHNRIVASPTHSIHGLALKLGIAWALHAGSERGPAADSDPGERLLWSALQDALRLADKR